MNSNTETARTVNETPVVQVHFREQHNDVTMPVVSARFSLQGFCAYLSAYRMQAIAFLLFLLLGYGQKLFSNTFSIDTQAIIADDHALYSSWYQLERFGLNIFKKLSGTWQYNNALASFCMVISFGLSALLWSYFFYGAVNDKGKFNLIAFTVPYVTAPIFAEMLGFLLLGPEVSIASSFVAVSLMILANLVNQLYSLKVRVFGVLVAFALTVMAFSMYLVMVTLFVCGTAMYYFLRFGQRSSGPITKGLKMLGLNIVVFGFGYIGYRLSNTVVMHHVGVTQNAYISDQSSWGKSGLSSIAMNLAQHFKMMYLGQGIFYTTIFTLVAVLFFVVSVIACVQKRLTSLALMDSMLIIVSPMMMSVVLGGDPSFRTEMSYPMAFGFMVLAISLFISKAALRKAVTWILVIIIGWSQGIITNRIFYTESVVFSQDVLTAQEIKSQVDALGLGETPQLPVVFIGNHVARCNADCFTPEQLGLTGRSMLEIGFSTEHGTFVKREFFEATLGVTYAAPSAEQERLAESIAADLPGWPSEGSVVTQNGMIIVKLS